MKLLKLFIVTFLFSFCHVIAQNNNDVLQLFPEISFETNDTLVAYYQKKNKDKKTLSSSDNFQTGMAYLHTSSLKTKALPYFKKAYKAYSGVESKTDSAILAAYYMARACQYNLDFEQAAHTYFNIDSILPHSAVMKTEINRQLNICKTAYRFMQNPIPVVIANAGNSIDSVEQQLTPVFRFSNNCLYYTSKEKKSKDIYFCRYKNKKWAKPKRLPNAINTNEDEELLFVSYSTESLIFRRNGDIYLSHNENGKWTDAEKLPPPVNSEYSENSAALSVDCKTLYFSSNRPGGVGGYDIYVATVDGNNKWTVVNPGKQINTIYNETSPMIMPDNSTLYFSSEGHINMGGYDIFSIDAMQGKNSIPANMRHPVNSPFDEKYFFPEISENAAWYSSTTDIEHNRTQIFRIGFTEKEAKKYTFISGNSNIASATFSIFEEKNNKAEKLKPEKAAGNTYFRILPQSDYIALIEADNHFFNIINFIHQTSASVVDIFEFETHLSPIPNDSVFKTYYVDLHNDSAKAYNDVLMSAITNLMVDNQDFYANIELFSASNEFNEPQWQHKLINSFIASGVSTERVLQKDLPKKFAHNKQNMMHITIMDSATKATLFPEKQRLLVFGIEKSRKQLLTKLSKNMLQLQPADNEQQIETTQSVLHKTIQPKQTEVVKFESIVTSELPRIVVVENVKFNANRANAWKSIRNLTQLADFLKANPTAKVEIGGYTDMQGRRKFNIEVAQKRAETVERILAQIGVDTLQQVLIKNYGYDKQLTYNFLYDKSYCWAALPYNRRVEIKLLEEGKDKLIVKQIDVPDTLRIPEAFENTVTSENLMDEIIRMKNEIVNSFQVDAKYIKVLPIASNDYKHTHFLAPNDSIKGDSTKKKVSKITDPKNKADTSNVKEKKLQKKVLEQMEENQPKKNLILDEDEYIFSILLLVSDEKVDVKQFSDLKGVKEHKDEYGRYIYYFGNFKEEYMAVEAIERIEDKYPQAYIFINTYDF